MSSLDDAVASALDDAMPDPDGAPRVITGWVAVATFADAEGFKQIAYAASGNLASWEARGMLHEVLTGG